jgi:peptidoglycan-N-acetylglucosamine deacetylase
MLHGEERSRRIESYRQDRRRIELRRRHRRRSVAIALAAAVVLAVSVVLATGAGKLRPATAPQIHAARPHPAARPSPDDLAVDRVRAYTPFVTRGGGRAREIALTFDDGPGPYTRRFVSLLARLHAPATFFAVGFMGRWFGGATAAAVSAGDVVGDHTERHPLLARLGPRGQRYQIVAQTQWVRKAGGRFPRLFRPPFGSFDRNTFALLRRYHMLMVLWSVDTDDYRRPGVTTIVQRALAGARPGAIVLMHDGGGDRSQTLAALPAIVRALRDRGYRLVTVPQLLRDDPPPGGQRLPHALAGG